MLRVVFGVLLVSGVPLTFTACVPSPGGGGESSTGVVVDIESGGSLEFQEDTLPAGTMVTGAEAGPVTLPLGVAAVGAAVEVASDGATTRPMVIRLPIPEGTDTDSLAMFQIRGDGTTTVLSTEVEDGFAVASTNHFTITPDPANSGGKIAPLMATPELDALRAALGIRDPEEEVPEVSPPRQATIVGPGFLAPGQSGLFSLEGFPGASGSALEIEWNLFSSGGTLAVPDGEAPAGSTGAVLVSSRSARVDVGAGASGRFDLTCDYVDPASGTRGFASKAISIQGADAVGELTLTFLEGSTERMVGVEGGGFLVGVLNDDVTTAAFDWDYGTGDIGDTGGQGQIQRTLRTPNVTYAEAGVFTLTITATAPDGRTGQLAIPVTVREDKVEAIITGPTRVERAASAFDSESFTVVITGGEGPYTVSRKLFPGGVASDEVTNGDLAYSLLLNEAGSYVQSVTVTDAVGETSMFTKPLTVTAFASDEFFFSFGADSTQVDIAQVIGFPFTAQGGVLIAGGVRARGYNLEVSWGDGESSETEVASDGSLSSVSSSVAHSYGEAGEYSIEAVLTDAVGNARTQTLSIMVGDEDGECPVTCTRDSDCTAASAGAACVDSCCFECETDDQCEGEQTCSESLECVDPCSFCCEGDGFCDTGDACSDPDCAMCGEDGTCITGCETEDIDCFVVTNITGEGGVSASSIFDDNFPAAGAVDGRTDTNWFSDGGSASDNAEVFTWVRTEAENASITRVETDPETFQGGGGFGFGQAQVTVLDVAGNEVYSSGFMSLAAFQVDLSVSLPAGVEGRTVQILLVDHQDPSCGGIAEFRVFGLRLAEEE